MDCYCDGVLPWPTCDSLLHLELRSLWSQAGPALSAAAARLARGMHPQARGMHPRGSPAGTVASAPATRRRLQQYASCDGADSLFSFDTSSGGCISGYCEAGLYGVGSVYGQVEASCTTARSSAFKAGGGGRGRVGEHALRGASGQSGAAACQP